MKQLFLTIVLALAITAIYQSCANTLDSKGLAEFSTDVDCESLHRGDMNFNNIIDEEDYSILASSDFDLSLSPCPHLADVNGDDVFDVRDIDSLWLLIRGIE